jgi:hypothetical protein
MAMLADLWSELSEFGFALPGRLNDGIRHAYLRFCVAESKFSITCPRSCMLK